MVPARTVQSDQLANSYQSGPVGWYNGYNVSRFTYLYTVSLFAAHCVEPAWLRM